MKKIMSIILAISMLMLPMTGCFNRRNLPATVVAKTLAEPGQPFQHVNPLDLDLDFRDSLWRFAGKTSQAALGDQQEDNALYSPASLYFALAMLTEGAKGQTKRDLLSFLEASERDDLGENMQRLYTLMTAKREGSQEHIANALWFDHALLEDKDNAIEQSFLDQLSDHYYAFAFAADLGDPVTAERMSAWVEEQTQGKIRPDMDLSDPLLLLVLMNTLYYRAGWATPFSPEDTKRGLFTNAQGKTIDVDFMHGVFPMTSAVVDEAFTAVKLPLTNGSIDFILPEEGIRPEALLSDPSFLVDFRNSEWEGCEAHLAIPKFEDRSKIDLLEHLRALGLADIVQNGADFTGIINKPDLLEVGAITQESFIAFDEKGIEAAAYTELHLVGAGQSVPKVLEMNLDHPYLYVISDQVGTPLFVGIVRNPK